MSYQSSSGYGYGGVPMPMPYDQSSTQTPYPRRPPSNYPVSQSSSQYMSSTQNVPNTSEIDQMMNDLVNQLKSLIKEYPNTELEQLVTNESKTIDLVQTAEQTKNLCHKKEEIVDFNKDQAVTNLSLEPEIGVVKNALMDLAQEQNNLQERHLQLQQNLAGKISLDSVLAILQASAAEKETETEKISQDLLDGSKTVEEFIEKFIPERTIYQLRKVKAEKMTQLLQSGAVSINRPTPVPRARPPQGNYGGYGGY